MDFEIFIQLIEKFGIITVLAWFMFRLESIIKENTQALNSLKEEIIKKK